MSNALYRVVVGYDFDEASERALTAARVAAQREHGELHIAAVVSEGHALPLAPPLTIDSMVNEQRRRLLAVAKSLGDIDKPLRTFVHVRVGHPAAELAHLALDIEADLVVVGTHQRSAIGRLLLGSVADRVAHLAPCPVLIVRKKGYVKVPEVEPPCPDCVVIRHRTGGASWWCAQHDARGHKHATHHYGYSGGLDPHSPLEHLL